MSEHKVIEVKPLKEGQDSYGFLKKAFTFY